MKNLVEYIRYVRKLFNEKGSNSLKTIVIGNSSGDMDSVISTIGYSYFSYLKDKGNKDIFPIISFLREDLKLRKDIEFTLKKVGIHEEDLIYVNELKDQERVSIVLVDHNEIDNEEIKELVESRHSKVVAVVDHHVDLGKYPDAAPRVVRKCGSCSSLVLAHFEREVRAAYAGTGTDTDTGTPAEVEFWVTAVGVDTAKMSSRVEREDVRVFAELFGVGSERFHAYVDTVCAAKLDIAGLSVRDLLRKDYKECYTGNGSSKKKKKIGVSSVGHSFAHLAQVYGRAAVACAVAQWQQQRRTDVCAVMTSYSDSYSDSNSDSAGFHREIALAGLSGSALTCLKQQLGLAPIDAGTAPPALALFKQNRTDLSRKAVLPLLVEVVENDTP